MEKNLIMPGSPGKSRHLGRVKWFSAEKGFGFIETEKVGDIFVYYTDIVSDGFKTLLKNQPVSFEIAREDRGPKAVNVRQENGHGNNKSLQ
jgi:cold shock protein